MKFSIIVLSSLCFYINNLAQTVGLQTFEQGNSTGYILYSGISSNKTYLIDKCGEKIQEWTSAYKPGLSVSLLPNGDLFRTGNKNSDYFGNGGGKGGVLEKYDWDGNLLWSYEISDSLNCLHHDAKVLPNGNILVIIWELKNLNEANQAGKNPSVTAQLNGQAVWSEVLYELQPISNNNANIVWEWHAWDHLIQDFDVSKENYGIVFDHPELIDVNYVGPTPPTNPDWLHFNSIDYNSTKDEIIISVHGFSEFWIIDHSTTSQEAASHAGGLKGKGGDLLYRWGNPQAYRRGDDTNQQLFKQHHATFIKEGFPNEGKVLIFNNGVDRPSGNYSSIDMVNIDLSLYPEVPPFDAFIPEVIDWTYTSGASFYAANISGVYPLKNGNFLITDGPKGEIFEISNAGVKVWSYINPTNNQGSIEQGQTPTGNTVFRAEFYDADYEAFIGKNLLTQGEIEINPISPSICETLSVEKKTNNNMLFYPNPVQENSILLIKSPDKVTKIELYDSKMAKMKVLILEITNYTYHIDIKGIKSGVYFINTHIENGIIIRSKIVIQ